MNAQIKKVFGAMSAFHGALKAERPKTQREFRSEFVDKITCGDAQRVLPRFPSESVNLVLTDPPFVVNYRPRNGDSVTGDRSAAWVEPAFQEIYRVLKRDSFCISSYGWHCADTFFNAWRKVGFTCVGHIVWVKPYSSGKRYLNYQHEQAVLLAKGQPSLPRKALEDVLPYEYTGNKLHPTQKPVSSLLPLVEAFSRPGDVVLDPFCGSGSALEAAAQLGRRYIGIEIVWKHFQTSKIRLSK
jgi:adenine-specific DNA-methyltransferase